MVAIECRGDAYEHPQAERQTNDAGEQAMLAEPCAKAPAATKTATGIGAAPARHAAAPGEHVLYMHHEVLVRELALALLLSEFVLERAIGRVDLSRPCLQRLDDRPRWQLVQRGWLDCAGRGWSLRGLDGAAGVPWLASPGPHRRRRRRARLRFDRHLHGQLLIRPAAANWGVVVAAHGLASGSRDIQRHHPVARQIAASYRVLRDDETDQLRWSTE